MASKPVSDIVGEAVRGIKGAIQFIEIEEADAIAKRIPAIEKVEIEQGAFGGRPPRPAESFNTLGYLDPAGRDAEDRHGQDRGTDAQLYLMRQNISAAVPGAGLLETPDLDEATPFLIHPGTRAYLNGDHKTLIDRYSDWIYLGAFIMGGLGSVVVGLFGWLGGRRKGEAQAPLRQLQALIAAVATHGPSDARSARAQRQRNVRCRLCARAEGRTLGREHRDFGMAMTELRDRIAARRTALGEGG